MLNEDVFKHWEPLGTEIGRLSINHRTGTVKPRSAYYCERCGCNMCVCSASEWKSLGTESEKNPAEPRRIHSNDVTIDDSIVFVEV